MNYKKIYDDFILDRFLKPEPIGYCEKHHIIPKSVGGSDNLKNIIKLTPEDHVFAHKLLARIYKTPGLWFALLTMLSHGGKSARGYRGSRREYGVARREYSNALKIKHPFRGKPLSDLHKMKISRSSPRLSGENHPMFGVSHSKETREKMRLSNKTSFGKDHPMFGRKHSEESKSKMRASSKRLRGADHPMFNRKHSKDSRRKMSLSRRAKPNHLTDKNNYKFESVEGNFFYGTIWDFCEKFGFERKYLHRLRDGKVNTYKGWRITNGTA